MGICIRIFIAAVQLAGQIIGFQMGFSMINVVDPQSGANISILSQLGYFTVLLVFVLMNGHHIIITAISDSFYLIEVGKISLRPEYLTQLRTMVTGMFILGIKMSSPALAALIFTDAAFGICAKFVPQMHILVVAMPVKIAIGLIMMGSCLEIIYLSTVNYLGTFKALLISVIKLFGG
jgi:flagellar biosynthetic protein FliR